MNQAEAELMIGEAVIAGALLPVTDMQDLADKAGVWSDFCRDVPYGFAREAVRNFQTGNNRFLTPNRLVNLWHDRARGQAHNTKTEYDCAWYRNCSCPHTDCINGQMREPEDKVTTVDAGRKGTVDRITVGVRWCPRCWLARNIVREKAGKELREYGDMRP